MIFSHSVKISIPLRYNLEPLSLPILRGRLDFNSTKVQFGGRFYLGIPAPLVISIPLRYNLELQLTTAFVSPTKNFNSTKVQFGGEERCNEDKEWDISIPLRYNLEPLGDGTPPEILQISIPLRYNLEP